MHFAKNWNLRESLGSIAWENCYCPVCDNRDRLICIRGDLTILRPRRNAEPVLFELRSEHMFISYWSINLLHYEGEPQRGGLTETELLNEINQSHEHCAKVVIMGPCTAFPKPKAWSIFFAHELVEEGGKSGYRSVRWRDPKEFSFDDLDHPHQGQATAPPEFF
jgi:hypothetical protein